MVCAAIEIYLERHGFDVTIAMAAKPGFVRWKTPAST
jgi:hypothetical protein